MINKNENNDLENKSKEWGIGLVLTFFALLWLTLIAGAWAEASESGSGSEKEDEYSFNWLDPEKKIYVLQNRKYLKTSHPLLSVLGGIGLSNPYRTTFTVAPKLAYYMSEVLGIEAFYTLSFNSPNSTVTALLTASGNTSAIPTVREVRGEYGAMLHYVPWYAKINVFNNILYFDWYFGAGAGQVSTFADTRATKQDAPSYQQQDFLAFFVSTGHHFHISDNFVIRWDLTGAFYSAPVAGTSGTTTLFSNFNFGIGLGWKI